MVDASNYGFKSITDKTIKLEVSFVNLYIDKLLESNSTINSTRRMLRILDEKYKCQYLTATESHRLLHLLNKFEDLFDGTLGMWKTTPVDFELKDHAKPVCSRPYPVPKVHIAMFRKKVERLLRLVTPE